MRVLGYLVCMTLLLIQTVRADEEMLSPWPMYQSDSAASGTPHISSRALPLDSKAFVTSFELLDNEHLIWTSSPDAQGKAVFAMMQVDTHETEKVINMQRFANHLHSVTCGASQTRITFVHPEAFRAAVEEWSWVNLADEHLMHVLAYWKDCLSSEGNFKPFHFRRMSTDEPSQTIILEGAEQEWSHALHSFALEIGDGPDEPELPPPPPPPGSIRGESRPLKERNLNEKRNRFWRLFRDLLKHGWKYDHSKKLVANLNSNFGHKIAPKVSLNDHHYQAFGVCHNCYTSGTVTFMFRFRMQFFTILQSDVVMTMQNVGAGVEWEVGVYAENTISLDYLQSAWKLGFGPSRVYIPGVADIGMYVQAAWGIGATHFRGRFNVTGGIALHIPNGSKVHIDFLNYKIDHGDFIYTYDKTSPQFKGVAEGSLYANTVIGAGARFQIFGHITYDLILQLRYPELGFEIAVEKGGVGPCGPGFSSPGVVSVRPFLGLNLRVLFGKGGSLKVLLPINANRDLTSKRHSRVVRDAEQLSELALSNFENAGSSLGKRAIVSTGLIYNVFNERFYPSRTQCFGSSYVLPPPPH